MTILGAIMEQHGKQLKVQDKLKMKEKEITNELPKISIIILNYNGKKWLKDCFESLDNLDYPKDKYEVIMGDNASSDDSVEYVMKSFPWIRVLKFDKNYGFCKGNNLCAKEAKGDYLVFLNNDTFVEKDWLKELVKGVLSEKDIISAGCKMLKPYKSDNNKLVLDYAGGKLTFELNFYEGIYEEDNEKFSVQKYTGFGCGAGVIVKKDFFLYVGGFDEYYFAGGEELELGLRAWQYGYKVLYIPSSVMVHKRYGTFKNMNVNMSSTKLWAKIELYLILKNYELKNIILFLPQLFFLVYLPKIIFFIINRQPKGSIAVIEGIFEFLKDIKERKILKKIFEYRKRINRNKKRSDKDLYKMGLMATFKERLKYTIKNAKMYNQLKK